MKTITVHVTPALASEWLQKIPARQRNLSETVVRKYADDMARGWWKLTHQSIAIDEEGNVVDGQHRLSAVVLSGATVEMSVTFDAPAASFDHVDMGYARNASAVLSIRGVPNADKDSLAMVRQLHFGHRVHGDRHATIDLLQELLLKHRDAISFVSSRVAKDRMRRPSAPVLGAVALAWYHEQDKDRLGVFLDILADGFPRDVERDRVAVDFHAHLLRAGTAFGSVDKRDRFLLTQRVIKAHMKGERLGKFYVPSSPIYPAPE